MTYYAINDITITTLDARLEHYNRKKVNELGIREESYELRQRFAEQTSNLENLEKERSQKEVELDSIKKQVVATSAELRKLEEALKECYDRFIDNLSQYEDTIMRRIASGDEAFKGLEKVFIREEDNCEDYVYRPAFNYKTDESGEVENNYCSYGANNESHARQNDCRLDAIERAIVGDDGILVTSERGLYDNEIIRIFAFFYREAKPKKLEAVLARFKKAIEDEEWVGEKYRGDIERYLFDLYIAPKTTQKT